jgi:hypothetical protein
MHVITVHDDKVEIFTDVSKIEEESTERYAIDGESGIPATKVVILDDPHGL